MDKNLNENQAQGGENRTELEELGEFGLIDRLTESFSVHNPQSTLKGVGDDAAVLQMPQGQVQLVSKDLLMEGVHFDMTYCPLKHLGYKAIAVNLSDIAAMNAKPAQVLVGIAVSNRYSLEALEELYAGMRLCCDRYGVDLVGGDTVSSRAGLAISVTVIGYAEPQKVAYRGGAKENDLLCVSGNLGGAYAGLLLLEREKREFLANPKMQPDFQDFSYVLERQLKPEPRLDIVDLLAELNVVPTSMIDVSDGLASEILHLSKASDCGCMLYQSKIPVDAETCKALEMFKILPETAALSGGEDYELLFTVAQKDYEKIKDNAKIKIIGHMVEKAQGTFLVPENGSLIPLTAQGWQAFNKR
ncbi:MAG: thiamine-phosphate kinase [Lentimicrobiaceae bacterium]|nr:thiamine-phosphate kinase [Lentimicrobiaceae bacterium]